MQAWLVGLLTAWFSWLYLGRWIERPQPEPGDWMYHAQQWMLTALFVGSWLMPRTADWVLLPVLLLHSYMQYRNHWHLFFCGVSPERAARYNAIFAANWRIVPPSANRIVPDGYHTILHVLLAANLVGWALRHLP